MLRKFDTVYDQMFPEIPCSYCGILLLDRHIKWKTFDDGCSYGIITVFSQLPCICIVRDMVQTAVCTKCVVDPQEPPSIGPWPDLLLSLPQRSRIFLSLVQLQTSLRHLQGQNTGLNPYTNYRTLSG